MPLMGSLYIGTSGLQTSQNSLNTTAHNLSNLDTTGFVRQQILQGSAVYNTIRVSPNSVANQQVGTGVVYSKVRQVRDVFLDKTFRMENGRNAFYEASAKAIEEVEGLLGELGTSPFSESVDDLWQAIQELSKNPASATNQTLLVQRAAEFATKSTAIYQGLCDYQDNLNFGIYTGINQINDIGNKIKELNDQIREIETAGIETANDLRDVRNQLLDELSALADITYSDDLFGNIVVKIEGNDFVTAAKCYNIEMDIDPTTGFYTPFWPQNATYTMGEEGAELVDFSSALVFRTDRTISSATNTDIGSIKSMLYARGDRRANYTDLEDPKHYNDDIAQSVIMNVQAEYDQLIHAIVTGMNKVLEEASDEATGYLCNADGSPIQLFTKKTTNAYEKNELTGEWEFVEEDPEHTETLYTSSNIQINIDLVRQPSMLNFVKEDGSEDFTTISKLEALFEEEKYTLNPNLKSVSNFSDYYADLISQVSNTGNVFLSIVDSQTMTVDQTDAAREQIMGVSSEDELSGMIRFQNAYNAASRYITVIDEMLEHLVSTLGA